jgi:hypothetical protein
MVTFDTNRLCDAGIQLMMGKAVAIGLGNPGNRAQHWQLNREGGTVLYD